MDELWYKYFNYGTIAFVAALLVLVLTDSVPQNWLIPLLIISIIIFIARIVVRVYIINKAKSKNKV